MTAPKTKAAAAYLSIREAADHLGVGVGLMRGLLDRGELLAVMVGAARRIARRELERYCERLEMRARGQIRERGGR